MNLQHRRELQGLGLLEFCDKNNLSLAFVMALEAGFVPLNGEIEILKAYKISKEEFDSHYYEFTEGSKFTPYRVASFIKRKVTDAVEMWRTK